MPLFEYECKKCGHRFEELVSSSAAKPPKCPKCSSTKTQRLMSTFSASFHESGSGSSSCPTGTCPFS